MEAMLTNRTHLAETTGILQSCVTLFPQLLNIWSNMNHTAKCITMETTERIARCHYEMYEMKIDLAVVIN